MYIKEIELRLESYPDKKEIEKIMQENQVSKQEAVYIWFEKCGKWTDRAFLLKCRNVAEYFERMIPKLNLGDFWKISVVLFPKIETNERYIKPVSLCGNVWEYSLAYDEKKFENISELDFKKNALSALMEGLLFFCEEYNIDKQIFLDIEKSFIDGGYINKCLWKKKCSPVRHVYAELFYELKPDRCDISVVIHDRDEVLYDNIIMTTEPSEWDFIKYLGDIKWLSKTKLNVTDKDKKSFFEIDIGM